MARVSRCRRIHNEECLVSSNVCFGCGKTEHKIRNYATIARDKGDSLRRAQSYLFSGLVEMGNKIGLHSLQTQEDHEGSLDVAIGKLRFMLFTNCEVCLHTITFRDGCTFRYRITPNRCEDCFSRWRIK